MNDVVVLSEKSKVRQDVCYNNMCDDFRLILSMLHVSINLLNRFIICKELGFWFSTKMELCVIHPSLRRTVNEKENASSKTGIDVTCPICLDKAEQVNTVVSISL